MCRRMLPNTRLDKRCLIHLVQRTSYATAAAAAVTAFALAVCVWPATPVCMYCPDFYLTHLEHPYDLAL